MTTASTTSFTVPPSASLIRLKVASSERDQAKRRCGPISRFSGTSGAGSANAPATSPTPSSASTARFAALSGWRTAPSARSASFSGAAASSVAPRVSSSVVLGAACGCQPSSAGAGSGIGSRSKSTVPMSTPAIPSTAAWCVLVSSAKRSRSSPCTSHISHSGLERSSCWEKTRAVSSFSCSSPPGSGSAVWRMW